MSCDLVVVLSELVYLSWHYWYICLDKLIRHVIVQMFYTNHNFDPKNFIQKQVIHNLIQISLKPSQFKQT